MTAENPNLITHVPSAEELAQNRANENAINFRDPAQLASFNEALVANGLPPREAPGPYVHVELPRVETPYHEPYIEPAHERTLRGAELAEVRRQAAAILGHEAAAHTTEQ